MNNKKIMEYVGLLLISMYAGVMTQITTSSGFTKDQFFNSLVVGIVSMCIGLGLVFNKKKQAC